MELSESNFGKLHELKAASDCEITKTISSKSKLEIRDNESELTCILHEKHAFCDENNNSTDNIDFSHKEVDTFIPNISLQCQQCSFETVDALTMITHIRLTHKIGNCNERVLDSLRGSHDTSEVQVPEIESSGQILKSLLVAFGDVHDLYAPGITNKLISRDDRFMNRLGNVMENFESERIKDALNLETDEKEKLEDFSWIWKSIYDENNNNLDELIQRQNSVEITEKFQDFMVQNYISVGKSIPEIVELNVDYTKIVDLDFHVCPMCEQKFENSLTLKNHLVVCEDKPHLFCSYCSYKTKYVSMITNHILKKHFQNKSVECPRCYKKMGNRNSLNAHLSYCGKERIFKCDECTYRTNIKTNLRLHISRIHEHSEQECPECNRKFKNLPSLKDHLKNCKKKFDLHSESLFGIIKNHCKLGKRCKDGHVIKGKFVKVCPKCFHFVGSSKKMFCCLCRSQLTYQCRKCAESFDEYRALRRHTLKC